MATFSCVVIGNESLLIQCAETALTRGNTIAAVVTHNPDIRSWAEGHGFPVIDTGKGLADRLQGLRFDWLLSIANLTIIPGSVLDLPAKGAINFHDGPLPRHAGLNAPVWALIEGETRHGITWHLIDKGVDQGDILVSRGFDITPGDTALTLNAKAYTAAIESFDSLLDQLEGDLKPVPQDLSQRSYHARNDRPLGYGVLDFSRPATDLERLVRALDHGGYWNPLCMPKLVVDGSVWLVHGAAQIVASQAAPGTVVEVSDTHVTIACGQDALRLTGLQHPDGAHIAPSDHLSSGAGLLVPERVLEQARTSAGIAAPHVQYWRETLAGFQPLRMPGLGLASGVFDRCPLDPLAAGDIGPDHLRRWALALGEGDGILVGNPDSFALGAAVFVTPWQFQSLAQGIDTDLARRATPPVDIFARAPDLHWPQTPALAISLGACDAPLAPLTLVLDDSPCLLFDTGTLSRSEARLLAARLTSLVRAGQLLSEAETKLVLHDVNLTETPVDGDLTMHRAFETQVARTPDAIALVFETQSLTYAALNARANQAAHLLRDMGVRPGTVVGLCCHRSVDLLVGALAILKAGGAYLPMDPAYPAERLQHVIDDSGATIIVTQTGAEPHLPRTGADRLCLDADPRLPVQPRDNLPDTATPGDLAYLIYTSGSTGKPKGVMVEHRNVMNFYLGMDQHIPHDPPGTWLAVTSLSFDISVLELFWTTARGFKVVLTSDQDRGLVSNGPLARGGGMQFSLYYWGNDDGVGPDKYKTLIEGARFADDNGFVAVWTPERHFHAFGGPYPNPSVTGAAVAGFTRNLGVRAGSVVAPLHHPARIAEEWAVIDNLTNGRAGLAIASGWQPDDFVLRPENTPPQNKPAMIDSIQILRKLWRGEPVGFPRKDGTLHEVVTQPRPVSRELPVWVTTAGNPDTWKDAGRLGCNVLTHLLGQSIDEVADKIRLYHAALREAGHDPAEFTVTLMLHTCLAATRDQAREIAREPMKDYLRSAAGLIKQYAWAFPAFKRPQGVKTPFELDLGSLSEDDLEGILDFAFERYFNDSGLFGTVEDALRRTEDLRAIGVGEIACLIDYGMAPDQVLDGLGPLAQVVKLANTDAEPATDDFSIAAQILRHKVTHLQCTPSMARMIALNDEARFALRGLRHLFVGGEPLPGALVQDFAKITQATVTNMYGPTETTIWSSVERAAPTESTVNIGLPLANQQMYVLDPDLRPVGIGQQGELWIAGQGVTRGYWNRPDLTAERFVDNPFGTGRMYRTGDLVRRRIDGRLDFVGRADHQVKLRGFRIELGEIESVLSDQPGVAQAVVLARQDTPGDMRLVGYYTGTAQDETALRTAMARRLPAFMVPWRFVRLDSFPLTPNKKVDRKALPAPQAPQPSQAPQPPQAVQPLQTAPRPSPAAASGAPAAAALAQADGSALEGRISLIWSRILGVPHPSARDSFFDLGGHSLLAVQAHRLIRDELGAADLSITDIFRFPVLADLAARVAALTRSGEPPTSAVSPPSHARADSRSDAMARRRAMRARRSA